MGLVDAFEFSVADRHKLHQILDPLADPSLVADFIITTEESIAVTRGIEFEDKTPAELRKQITRLHGQAKKLLSMIEVSDESIRLLVLWSTQSLISDLHTISTDFSNPNAFFPAARRGTKPDHQIRFLIRQVASAYAEILKIKPGISQGPFHAVVSICVEAFRGSYIPEETLYHLLQELLPGLIGPS